LQFSDSKGRKSDSLYDLFLRKIITSIPTNMANLTKRDLVVAISNETGLIQSDVFNVIQRTLDHITEALSKGEGVELRNFGVFEVRLTRSRVGRNPNQPDVDVPIPSRATVKFKAGKIMRQRVLLRTEELRNSTGVKSSDTV
jgi:nucleoid DNA-binding protein